MIVKNKHEQLFEYPQMSYYEGKTLRYLIPVVGMRLDKLMLIVQNIHFSAIDILRYIGLRGIYIKWDECPDRWENEVYMVFNPKREILYSHFSTFCKYLKVIPNFIKLYHVNNNLIVVSMRIDEKWKNCKEVVMTGKYSELGKTYANTFFNNGGKLKKEFHIICKTDEYRRKLEIELGLPEDYLVGMELDDFFDIEKETLNLQKLNIQYKKL